MSSTISIYIKGFDEATSALRKASNSVRGLSTELKKTSSAAGAFKHALSTAAGMLMRDVVRGLARTISEAITLGGQIDTLKASFRSLTASVGAASLNLDGLRKATNNTVSDVKLLTAANQALMLGLPTEGLDELFGAAIKLGHAMGIDAAFAVDSLTKGIGRQSKIILDNLGVVFDATEAYDWYAASLGVTANQLSEATRKEAWMAYAIMEVTEKARVLGDVTSDAQTAQEQWTASIENAKTRLGGLLGPLGRFSGLIADMSPMIGMMAATLLPSLVTAIVGVEGAVYSLKIALDVLKGPIGWVIGAITLFAAAVATNFMGIRDIISKSTADQITTLRKGYTEQLRLIDNLVSETEAKYAQLENILADSYSSQLTEAQQHWMSLIKVTASGWDNVAAEYEGYYDKQVADINAFYDEKLSAARQYLNDVRGLRDADLDALELQFLKEKQVIEDSETSYANKQILLERLERKFNEERSRLSEDYRVKELEAEQKFNEEQPKIEEERVEAVKALEAKKLEDVAAIREQERTLEEQHTQDLADLEVEKQEELNRVAVEAYQKRLQAEQQFNKNMIYLRQQMYEDMKRGVDPSTLGEEASGYMFPFPFVPAQHGFEGVVRRPTLFLAGEAGAERVSIGAPRGKEYMMGQPQRNQFVFNAPLVYVEGSADEETVTQAVSVVHQTLQNIVIEASSASAPATHKRIRVGGTTPTTVPPSTTTLAPGGGGAGSPFRKWI